MANFVISATRAGQTIPNKTINLSDAAMDAIVAAYQNDANAFAGGTATYAQVLNFVIISTLINEVKQRVQRFQTQPAVVPAPIGMA